MNNHPSWILIDTETTGFAKPIYTVELAAQRMRGWERDGKPLRYLLNHGCQIPTEVARVHGYTREILERDGSPPEEVYREFAAYASGLPVVAYNTAYDWDQVLVPEWQRLGLESSGVRGFCALQLAQRLLDPVPAGNCKLQTLRQYYRLSEHGAHTALGDVETVIDLMQQVLRPLAEKRGLDTWEKLMGFLEGEWYPSRLAFGKYKGRLYQEAVNDRELRGWLEWLAESTNEKSSHMGRWYLTQLANGGGLGDSILLDVEMSSEAAERGLVIYRDPGLEHYQRLIELARNRLADLELDYGVERARVDSVRSRLFVTLRPYYQLRDRLRLLVQYRKAFIDRLLSEGEDAAAESEQDFQRETDDKDREYDSTASALEGKRELNDDEATKLKQLWKKLVRMFHPDLVGDDPEIQKTYVLLTQAINDARDRGDMELLESIAMNPQAFILKQGWASVSLDVASGLMELRALYEHLQAKILEMIETLDDLRSSADFALCDYVEQDSGVLDQVAAAQRADLEQEIETLSAEAERRAKELEELTGEVPF
jgi:DNA polymerase III epsilon subunit-like protein